MYYVIPPPPRLEQLKNSETNLPTNPSEFLTNLLKSDCGNSDVIKRLVHSYGSDLIHAVTRGKAFPYRIRTPQHNWSYIEMLKFLGGGDKVLCLRSHCYS